MQVGFYVLYAVSLATAGALIYWSFAA